MTDEPQHQHKRREALEQETTLRKMPMFLLFLSLLFVWLIGFQQSWTEPTVTIESAIDPIHQPLRKLKALVCNSWQH